jgi:repressor LexA
MLLYNGCGGDPMNLLSLRKKKGITQKELASYLGISRQAYANYEAQTREPPIETLIQLADFFEISVDELLRKECNENINKRGVRIPVFGTVAAGIPIEAITDIEDYEEITEELAATGEYVALKIKGDSMTPMMIDGDTVIVRIQETIESGETAVVMINGSEATCKKVRKTPEGIILIPTNNSYDPMFFTNQEVQDLPIRIFGKVVEMRRSI